MQSHRLESCGPVVVLGTCLALLAGCGSGSQDEYTDRMAAEHEGDRPVAGAAGDVGEAAGVATREVSYASVDGEPVTGYLARPEGDSPRPGVVVIHEWWGLNDNIRTMARELAAGGYAALAVDLYRGETASDADGARELMSSAMEREEELQSNLRQAYEYLRRDLEAPRVGVIGWCFGGGWSLRTALMLPGEIDATVIYYGRPVSDRDRLAALEMPILGIFGEEDQGIPVEGVREFESVLDDLGKQAEIHVYEGAGHAFANPSGTRYVPEAARDAWAKTLAFFSEHLKS